MGAILLIILILLLIGRATGLALQLGLGLLAQRRHWINPVSCNSPRSHRTPVNG